MFNPILLFAMKQLFLYGASFFFVVLSACTDPITVGGDLLDEDRATVGETTEIPFTTRVVEDSLLVFDAGDLSENALTTTFTFGQLEDEVFGRWRNSVYFSTLVARERNTGLAIRPEFAFTDEADVDSVVFLMPIDTSVGFYGTQRDFGYSAGLVIGLVDDQMSYYSDVDLFRPLRFVNENNVFSASTTPSLLYDTLYVSNGDSITLPHIRVKMNDELLEDINEADENKWNSDSALATLLPGIFLEPADDVNGLVSLRPRTTNQPNNSGFFYFYQDSTDNATPDFFQTQLNLWLPRYERDYAGSLVGDLLEEGDDNERIAVTGQAGVMTEITFPDLSALEGKVINKAELKFFREAIENYSYEVYEGPARLSVYFRDEVTGTLVPINDFNFIVNPTRGAALAATAGGQQLTDDAGNVFYAPRISLHLQNMVEGLAPNKIYLRVVPLDREPGRVILKGPNAAEQPATLTVTFTDRG